MKEFLFKNNGSQYIRLTSLAGHVTSFDPGEEKLISEPLRVAAIQANLTALDKTALEQPAEPVLTKAQKAAAAKAAKAAQAAQAAQGDVDNDSDELTATGDTPIGDQE